MQAVAARSTVTYRRKNKPVKLIETKKRENVHSKEIMNAICLFLLFIGIASFLNLYQRVIIMQNTREIEKITLQIKEEKTSYERNELKLTQMKSPEKIQKIAVEELKMADAKVLGYIVLPSQTDKKRNLNYFSYKWSPGR